MKFFEKCRSCLEVFGIAFWEVVRNLFGIAFLIKTYGFLQCSELFGIAFWEVVRNLFGIAFLGSGGFGNVRYFSKIKKMRKNKN